ncbi:MAG: leucine-rich repeat domain-containing protein, partial [Dehalococcoidales bacterium]|nr:leucine-rich repeat domain-containing protein [Dehalococcoidales bacterium]
LIYASDLETITELNLYGFQEAAGYGKITNLTGLEYCLNLKKINAQSHEIVDISPLVGLSYLESLDLNRNGTFSDISPVAGLTRLNSLHLLYTAVSDVSPLLRNKGFSSGVYLCLEGCPLTFKAKFTDIPILEARGVRVVWRATPMP